MITLQVTRPVTASLVAGAGGTRADAAVQDAPAIVLFGSGREVVAVGLAHLVVGEFLGGRGSDRGDLYGRLRRGGRLGRRGCCMGGRAGETKGDERGGPVA